MKKSAYVVLMATVGMVSLTTMANATTVTTPKYLSVPHHSDCFVTQKAKTGTSTELVLPKTRPAKCPKDSWSKLKKDVDKKTTDKKASKSDDNSEKDTSNMDTSNDEQQHLLKGQPQD